MQTNSEPVLRSAISHAALSAGVAFSWAALSDAAQAQSNVTLDTIDVTGQQTTDGTYSVPTASSPKQTAPLLDTPQTVTVVPQAIIRERNATTLTEVLRNTPGITFDGGENGFGTSMTNFKLRGFDTSGSVFIDGSRDNGTYARDVFNVERVEIFKGPAADNGRGGAGGYINLVTKTPTLKNFFTGEVGVGFDGYKSDARKRATADVNRVVAPNTAVRFNAMWEDGGVAGRDIAEAKAWGVAPSVTFGLGTDKRATFSYEHLTRKDLPDWGIPAHVIPGMARYTPSVAGVSRDTFYGLRSDFDDVTSDVALARFEYDLSKAVTVSNQTRWSRVERNSRFTQVTAYTPATQMVTTQNQVYERVNTTLTNLTNLSAEVHTGPFKHNLSMGVELSRETSDANRFNTGANTNTNVFNPDPNRAQGSASLAGSAAVKVNTVAAYLYDTMHLNRQWQITGGVRVEHYNVDLTDIPGGANNFTATETTLGGKIGVVYKPVDHGSFYASVGLSHRPPASYLSTPDISRTGNNAFPGLIRGADPIRSINYEIGTKWDFFNGRLSTTAALFRSEQRVPLNPGGNIYYSNEIVQGLELGVAGNITERWKVFGGVLLIDSQREVGADLNAALIAASPGDFVGLDGRVYSTVDGNELAFTPNFSANLWTTYRLPTIPLTIGAGLQHVGSSWIGRPDDAARVIPNGVFGKLPGYTLLHMMASYELRKDVELRFNVDNVTDKLYAVSTNWPAQRVQLGAPRTYRISTNFKF